MAIIGDLPKMKKLIFLLCLVTTSASAQVVNTCMVLHSDATTDAASATATNAIITALPITGSRFTGVLIGSNVSGSTPTMDIKIQSCIDPDEVDSCIDTGIAFTQCTTGDCGTNGYEADDLGAAVNIFKYVRVLITLGGTSPVYDAVVRLCAGK